MKHLFLIDPLDKLNLKLDSSLRWAFELINMGQEVHVAHSTHLSWETPQRYAKVESRSLAFLDQDVEHPVFSKTSVSDLRSFDSIQMRKEPPFDLGYLTATWCLDTVAKDVLVVNHPQALRDFNEKVAVLRCPPQTVQPSLLSEQPAHILEFLKSTPKGEAILKPLHLFGGQGIQRISLGDWATEEAALAGLTRLLKEYASPVMVQSFHEEVFRGEVRVFTMDGQPLSWCLKVPAQGQFLANTRWGARLEGYHPSPGLRGHMVQVAEEFARKGAYLLGFDVIGEAITEINLTSPRLLQAPEDPTNYYEVLAQWLLEKIKTYNLPQGVLR